MFPSFRCANDCKTRSCISFAINETKRIFNKSVRNFDIPRYIHISWQLLAPARGRRNRQGAMNRLGASLERSRPSSVTSSWWFFLPRFLSGLPLSSLFSPLLLFLGVVLLIPSSFILFPHFPPFPSFRPLHPPPYLLTFRLPTPASYPSICFPLEMPGRTSHLNFVCLAALISRRYE